METLSHRALVGTERAMEAKSNLSFITVIYVYTLILYQQYICVLLYVCVYVCIYICMYVCMYVRMYVSVSVSVCMYLYR